MRRITLLFSVLMSTAAFTQTGNHFPTVGNVGIGTTAPAKTLDVNGSASISNSLSAGSALRSFGTFQVDGTTYLKSDVLLEGLGNYSPTFGSMEVLIVLANGEVKKTTLGALAEAMAEPYGVDYCGDGDVLSPKWFKNVNKLFSPCPEVKVGIGTSDPEYQLSVPVGLSYFRQVLIGNSTASTDATINGFAFNHSTHLLRLGKKIGGLAEEERFIVRNDGSTEITNVSNVTSFKINNGAGHAVEVLSSTGQKILQLEDDGLLRGRKIRLDEDTWADYVFEKNYRLMPLGQLKKYIQSEGHLPNVPSANEITTNGVDVSDMLKVQMEKIEELSLYMIEMNERLNKLETENERLKIENSNLKK